MNRENKKARFNFIDAIIIFIILAIIGAAVYLIVSDIQSKKDSRQLGNLDCTVRISNVDEAALSLFTIGETVKDSVTGEPIGTIMSVTSNKAKYYGTTAILSGMEYVISVTEHEKTYDVYVTISATAKKDARDIYYVGNNKILVGSTIYFKIPSFTAVSFITDFKPTISG